MAYTPKPGEGTLSQNRAPGRTEKSPGFKGYFILPDGSVIGLAQWKVSLENGVLLSLKLDDKEGAYWAKKLGRAQTTVADMQAGGSAAPAERSRHAKPKSSDDLDDEIPF